GVVSTVHGAYHPILGTSGWTAVRRHTLSRAYRLTYRLFDRVIAVSDYVRPDLPQRPGIRVHERVDVIHHGIDVSRIGAGEEARDDEDRQPVGKMFQIVNVANFFAIKGHEWLLRALPGVIGRWPATRCVLVGDGPERPRMERLAADLALRDHVV